MIAIASTNKHFVILYLALVVGLLWQANKGASSITSRDHNMVLHLAVNKPMLVFLIILIFPATVIILLSGIS